MRNLFLVLVLANLAFAGWHQWLAEPGTGTSAVTEAQLPGIALMSEVEEPEPAEVAESFPPLAAAASLSWLVIGLELALAWSFAFGRPWCAPATLVFHGAIFVFTGSTFGMFFYAGLAAVFSVIEPGRTSARWTSPWVYFLLATLLAGPWVRFWSPRRGA